MSLEINKYNINTFKKDHKYFKEDCTSFKDIGHSRKDKHYNLFVEIIITCDTSLDLIDDNICKDFIEDKFYLDDYDFIINNN